MSNRFIATLPSPSAANFFIRIFGCLSYFRSGNFLFFFRRFRNLLNVTHFDLHGIQVNIACANKNRETSVTITFIQFCIVKSLVFTITDIMNIIHIGIQITTTNRSVIDNTNEIIDSDNLSRFFCVFLNFGFSLICIMQHLAFYFTKAKIHIIICSNFSKYKVINCKRSSIDKRCQPSIHLRRNDTSLIDTVLQSHQIFVSLISLRKLLSNFIDFFFSAKFLFFLFANFFFKFFATFNCVAGLIEKFTHIFSKIVNSCNFTCLRIFTFHFLKVEVIHAIDIIGLLLNPFISNFITELIVSSRLLTNSKLTKCGTFR